MKQFFGVLALLLTASLCRAQDNSSLKTHYLKVYTQALQYNDVDVAIQAMHGYIAIDSNVNYKDTLSYLYFINKNYYSSLMLSEEVIKRDPKNVLALARAAECYQLLGDSKTSVNYFERVVPATKNPYHIYMLAVGQYSMKRMAECESNCRLIIGDTMSNKIPVTFNNGDGSEQVIPVSAGAYNLRGVMQMDTKNYEAAKKEFQNALAIFPQFVGAQQNMQVCENQLGKGKTPSKTPANKPKPKG